MGSGALEYSWHYDSIANGGEVMSDFRMMGDQEDLLGLVAWCPPRGAR